VRVLQLAETPGHQVPVLALNALPVLGLGFLAVGGLQIEHCKLQISNSETRGQAVRAARDPENKGRRGTAIPEKVSSVALKAPIGPDQPG
jgi:hypothetical protein